MARKIEPNAADGSESTTVSIEPRVIAFAEQLGSLIADVQNRAEGWLDPTTLRKEISRIRDGAVDLLAQLNRKSPAPRNRTSKPKAASIGRPGRGPVDAPGKRHRKPPPDEPIERHMGERRGKQMGQKNFKTGRRGGRR